MTTGVGGEEAWDDGSGGKDVQLDENDLFEENPPLLEKNLAEDPPSKARNGETANEYPQGLFGTTPPEGGRHLKVQKRKSKKVPSAVVTTVSPGQRKRPYSLIAPSTLDKEVDGERRRRNTESNIRRIVEQPGKSHSIPPATSKRLSPSATSKPNRDKKKERKKKSHGEIHEPLLSRRITKPEKPVSFSFQTEELSLPADLNRTGSAILVTSSQRFVCPPERKQFYRALFRSLKRTAGFAAVMGSREMGGYRQGTLRRGYSENLALSNPSGQFYEQIWLELRAYLYDQTVDELTSQVFFRSHEVDLVLSRINDFKIIDDSEHGVVFQPSHLSGCDVFSTEVSSQISEVSGVNVDISSELSNPAVGEEEEREEDEEKEREEEDEEEEKEREEEEEKGGEEEQREGAGVEPSPERQCSCDEAQRFTREVFLSKHQLSVLRKVEDLLAQLEEAGSWFPNSSRMDQAHPKCRNSNFRRRVEALTLWHKVTLGLADCLSRLSTWVGAQVTVPEACLCMPITEPSTAVSDVRFVVGGGEEKERKDDLVMNSLTLQFTRMHTTSSSGDSNGDALRRLFSSRCGSDQNQCHSPYRVFVDRALKTSGLKELMKTLRKFISPVLELAKFALTPILKTEDDALYEERVPLLRHYLPPTSEVGPGLVLPQQIDCWIDEFRSMNLPPFVCMYIQLLRVPLDVMYDCLSLQLRLKPPQEPSPHSVKQLVFESRVTLEEAIEVYSFYSAMFEPASKYIGSKEVFAFENALQSVLDVYFDYVQRWVLLFGPHVLEDEWTKAKKICSEIRGKEAEAGRKFCVMVTHLLDSTADTLNKRLDECNENLHHLGDELERRKSIGEVCHNFKAVFVQVKERSSKVLAFAKLLCKDLEIAADFKVLVSAARLMEDLQKSNHHQVVVSNQICNMLFVPDAVASNHEEIQELLDASLGIVRDQALYSPRYSSHDSYLLLVAVDRDVTSPPTWEGKTVPIDVAFETTIAISEMEVHGLKMVVTNSHDLPSCCKTLLGALGSSLSTTNKQTSSHENVAEQISDLKMASLALGRTLMKVAYDVTNHLGMESNEDKADLQTHYQSTLQSCFNLGFEYVRELFRLLGEDLVYEQLGREMLLYAQLWMRFVVEHCERGRGRCPQWAMTGLDFVCMACAPCVLAIISYADFEVLKKLVKRCQEHLNGSLYNYIRPSKYDKDSADYQVRHDFPPSRRRRGASKQEQLKAATFTDLSEWAGSCQDFVHLDEAPSKPQLPQMGHVKVHLQEYERAESGEDSRCLTPGLESPAERSNQPCDREDTSDASPYHQNISLASVDTPDDKQASPRMKVIRQSVMEKDKERNKKLQTDRMIGRAIEAEHSTLSDLSHIAQVHYRWSRGRKLGEGKFGMVYECINWDTTECHAVKQLKIATKDFNTVKVIIDEISFYQKLNHPNIVKFYGVEIIKNDLYLFMEYCNEGTLWSIAQQGLTEPVMRLYTRDILKAVYEIHRHNIVHRDIKGANIFMSSNTVKLGDFGLSVQLKYGDRMQSGIPQHDAGTVRKRVSYWPACMAVMRFSPSMTAYMSPEVIRDRDVRPPMDIWSVGCVIVEMATRKIPWSECDNTYAILYQIGSGVSPKVDPGCLSTEGLDFLSHCFEVDPLKRWTAGQLCDHPFVKVYDEQ